jgi:hypothetical protein
MNLQETVSKILNKEVTVEEAKTFAQDQFGALATYIKNPPIVISDERVTEAMIQKAADDYLSMDYDDVARVLREIDLDANIKDGDMLDTCHEELQVAERFEFCFTVGSFFNQIR